MMWLALLIACGSGEPEVVASPEPSPAAAQAPSPKSRLDVKNARTAQGNPDADAALEQASAHDGVLVTVPTEPGRPALTSPPTAKTAGPPSHMSKAVSTSPHHQAGE